MLRLCIFSVILYEPPEDSHIQYNGRNTSQWRHKPPPKHLADCTKFTLASAARVLWGAAQHTCSSWQPINTVAQGRSGGTFWGEARHDILHFSETCRPTVGSTQRPMQWVFGAPSAVLRSGCDADHTHVRLVESLGIHGHTHSWRAQETPYLLNYLLTYLLTDLLTYLLTDLLIYLLNHLLTYLFTT